MKRGSVGEKIMGPMFPRLHINDTEKGGPRAPPRNKMALYEQLSIPSQRFNHAALTRNLSSNTAGLVSPSSQGGGNDRGMFFARQLHPIHPSEMQYSQYSDLSTPRAQVEQINKMDEDDYTVPIFVQPVPAECDKYNKAVSPEKFSPSNPPYSHPSLKFHKANGVDMLEHSIEEEDGSKKGENSNESVAGEKQTVSSISHERGPNLADSVHRLRTDDRRWPELCAESRQSGVSQNMEGAVKVNSSDSEKGSPLEDLNIVDVHDLSDDTGSREDEYCRPLETGSLERGDSVSESSILDTESALDITPDDIVGMIGQTHFWKARRAIMKILIPNIQRAHDILYSMVGSCENLYSFDSSQQRVFAVQVFELHRLIKVQKMVAAWPHLLLEDSSFSDKPTNPLARKKRPLDSAVSAASNASTAKGNSDSPSHKKERSAENSLEKTPYSASQNAVPPSSCRPSAGSAPPPPAMSGGHNNARTSFFNPPEGHGQQWLIPVMSPSEGLVYKPYPAPGFPGPSGPNPMAGSFLPPVFGIPTPMPQYPFPPYGPHGYFPPYGMPMMTTAAFSGSPMEQVNSQSGPCHFSGRESEQPAVDGLNRRAAEEIEVQGSSASSPSERQPGRRASNTMEERNVPPFLHVSPPAIDASKSSPRVPVPVRAPLVIKVVPRNGISASESAARIFRSIQEERMQYDSV